MTPERLQEVKRLFQDALAAPAGTRDGFLAEACGADDELRAEVESLLDAHDDGDSFLEHAVRVPADLGDASRVGQRLGAWEVVELIGQGGMGNVYRARRADGQFAKDAAIKVVKRGMDTDFILRRFRSERQILAQLDHPNIARLLDGGTTADGLPYFVMEHIDGRPIDAYCAEEALSLGARLELVRTVCAAVSYAHQSLVVHRDIKPSNILVTRGGVPKLLDFGIAKLLSATGGGTETQARMMTLDYASPEQVRGERITTATDVHALGLLLYELCAGRHPFRRAERDAAELARAIVDEEPARPSAAAVAKVRRALEGDLDDIILMALRKEPARRYASVPELAEDLRRHLAGLPVQAQKDTFGYRAGKFVRRNRLALAAGAMVAASLVGGIVATSWQAHVAARERARAERRFEDTRRVANALLFEIHDAIADVPGATAARGLLVERAAAYLDGLAADSASDLTLQRELVAAYLKLGDVQGNLNNANLGDFKGARASYAKALAQAEAVLRQAPGDRAARFARGQALDRMGDVDWELDDGAAALAHAREALASHAALAAEYPGDLDVRREMAALRVDIGDSLAASGDRAAALASYQEALAAQRGMPPTKESRRAMSITLIKIGDGLAATGDQAGALADYREALTLREANLAEDPKSAKARRDVSSCLTRVGNGLVHSGDAAGGLASYERALAMDEAGLAADPKSTQARHDVAVSLIKVADTHTMLAEKAASPLEDVRAARDAYARSLVLFRELEAGGKLTKADASTTAELVKAIGSCDAQLRR